MWTWNWLELQTLGSQPIIMPKNLPEKALVKKICEVSECNSTLDDLNFDLQSFNRSPESWALTRHAVWLKQSVESKARIPRWWVGL